MSKITGWVLVIFFKADSAASESQKIVKRFTGILKITRIAKRIPESSAVITDARSGRFSERENTGKTAPNTNPASDLELSVNTGVDASCK